MPSRLALLLLAAAVLGCARASRELEDVATGRSLLQTPTATDCNRSVAHCSECRYQFYKGTVTKAICTRCEDGYLVKNSGRACYCAPGFYTLGPVDTAPNVGFTCQQCGFDSYCPGAKVTAISSTVQVACGTNKMTTTAFAKSDRECVVKPGFGWAPGNGALACDQGFYNPGYNTRKCTKCPGSLTTLGTNSNSTQDCQAPAGYYYLRGKAVACARGTWKSDIANNDCNECPKGMTTPAGEVAQLSKGTCKVVLPGFSLASSHTFGDTAAAECPQDYYRAGEVTAAASGAVDCVACGDNMVTLPNVTAATTSDACVVPPGYGWVAPTAPATKGTASICDLATYNPGYNREPCVKCGNGTITTDAQGSTSADQCFTPAGDGNRRDPISGVLEGYHCPQDTYGRPNNTYGLVDVECTKCLEHTSTAGPSSTSADQCLTDAGFGWDNGQVNACEYGYWAAGGNQNPCTYCGDFFNTSATTNALAGERQTTTGANCRLDFGYQLAASGAIEACLRGFYKAVVGNSTCSQCPAGTSTTIVMAAVAKSDCDTCQPGFGIASGSVNLTDPSCDICTSGHYSSGWKRGGQACTDCPTTQNFTGLMVSRKGAASPEECFGEFITDDTNAQNFLWWDVIPQNDSSVFTTYVAGTTLTLCQQACHDPTNNCQYFEFYDATTSPTGTALCKLRAFGAITNHIGSNKAATWWDAPNDLPANTGLVLFEIREGSYVTYPKKDTEQVGTALDLTALGALTNSFKATRTACDKAPDCIGITWDSLRFWQPFKGGLWEGATGKVRVIGEDINSWVNDPTGLEVPEGWTSP